MSRFNDLIAFLQHELGCAAAHTASRSSRRAVELPLRDGIHTAAGVLADLADIAADPHELPGLRLLSAQPKPNVDTSLKITLAWGGETFVVYDWRHRVVAMER